MKKTDFGISKGIIIGFLVAIVSILCCGVNTKAVTKPKQLKVLFTHDIIFICKSTNEKKKLLFSLISSLWGLNH